MQRGQHAPDQFGILVIDGLAQIADKLRVGVRPGRGINQEIVFQSGFAHISLPGWLNLWPRLGLAPHKIECGIRSKRDKFQVETRLFSV